MLRLMAPWGTHEQYFVAPRHRVYLRLTGYGNRRGNGKRGWYSSVLSNFYSLTVLWPGEIGLSIAVCVEQY